MAPTATPASPAEKVAVAKADMLREPTDQHFAAFQEAMAELAEAKVGEAQLVAALDAAKVAYTADKSQANRDAYHAATAELQAYRGTIRPEATIISGNA